MYVVKYCLSKGVFKVIVHFIALLLYCFIIFDVVLFICFIISKQSFSKSIASSTVSIMVYFLTVSLYQ